MIPKSLKKTMRPKTTVIIYTATIDACEACGGIDELAPYGPDKGNGRRTWICFSCATNDEAAWALFTRDRERRRNGQGERMN